MAREPNTAKTGSVNFIKTHIREKSRLVIAATPHVCLKNEKPISIESIIGRKCEVGFPTSYTVVMGCSTMSLVLNFDIKNSNS